MEDIVTTLTHEEQALVRPVLRAGKTATRASLAGEGRIDFHGHALCQQGFVGDIAMQLGEGPRGSMVVCPPLLLAGGSAMLALGALTDVCQVFQSDDAVWVRLHNAMTDTVVAILLQPSLSSTDDDQSSCRGTSAFLLQPFAQSRIVIGFGPDSLARIEGCMMSRGRGDCQIALSNVHTDHLAVALRGRLCSLDLKCDKQVELLARFVVPQLGGPDGCPMLQEGNMLVIARVGQNHPSIKGKQTHPLLRFEAVVALVVVGEGRRHILGWLI